jgi:hypothetical protein
MGAAHDRELTIEEAEECFLEAVSGGARYGIVAGRGLGFFKRKWKSHLGSIRASHSGLGTLIGFCKDNGMILPWKGEVIWEDDYERQRRELAESDQTIDEELKLWLQQ